MKASRFAAYWLLAGILLIPALTHAHEEAAAAHPTLQAIEAELDEGQITRPEALLFRLYAAQGSTLLPDRYRSPEALPLKCGTPIIEEVRKSLAELPDGIRQMAETALQRPYLPEYIDTEHFRIHYATSGGDMIYGWPSTNYRDDVMEACENCWDFYHTQNGWDMPPSDGGAGGGSGLIDCYVDDVGTGIYGYAEAESQAPNHPVDYTAYFVIDNDYAGFNYADRALPMKFTVAHEYHHVVQMGLHNGASWLMENTSTYMEDEVYDEIDDNYQFLPCYFGVPYNNLEYTNGCWEYGCFIWPTYLDEGVGGHALVRDIWHSYAEILQVKDCIEECVAPFGLTYDTAVAGWARWNVFTGTRDDGDHYVEGGPYNRYVSTDHNLYTYPQYDLHPSAAKKPMGLGANYTKLRPETGSTDNVITIEYDGPDCSNDHEIAFARKFDGQEVYEEYVVQLDSEGMATFELDEWDQTEWMFMIVPMERICGASGQDFVFSVVTSWEQTDVGDFAQPTRVIRLDQNRPNPFSPKTTIEYALPEAGRVLVNVYDASGRHVRTLVDGTQSAGSHEVVWNGADDEGHAVPVGLYLYSLQVGDERVVRKMLYVE